MIEPPTFIKVGPIDDTELSRWRNGKIASVVGLDGEAAQGSLLETNYNSQVTQEEMIQYALAGCAIAGLAMIGTFGATLAAYGLHVIKRGRQ